MYARDLAEPCPFVTTDDPATEAVQMLARYQLPASLVVDADEQPYAIVLGSQLIQQLVPAYLREVPPPPSSALDDRYTDKAADSLEDLTAVAAWLPRRAAPPVATPDGSGLNVAGLMARVGSPLVAVVERRGDRTRLVGAITATRLAEQLIGGT